MDVLLFLGVLAGVIYNITKAFLYLLQVIPDELIVMVLLLNFLIIHGCLLLNYPTLRFPTRAAGAL